MLYKYVKVTTENHSYVSEGQILEIVKFDPNDNMILVIDNDGDECWLEGPEGDPELAECQYCDENGNIISPSTDYAIF